MVSALPAHRDAYIRPNLCSSPRTGHINHSLFWKNLAPASCENKGIGGSFRDGPLKEAILKQWGSFDNFRKEFNATTAAIQGSGWGWVGYNPETGKLEVVTTANQDPLLCECCGARAGAGLTLV